MGKRLKILFSESFKAIRRLFLETLGAFFLFLSVAGFGSSFYEYRRYVSAPVNGALRLSLTLIFAAAMLFSGLHSLWKARKIR